MDFTIPNNWFILVIAVLTIYLTFLTSKGGLTDNRYNNFLKRITTRGRIVIIVLICMSIVLWFQDINYSNHNNVKDGILKIERSERDEKITEGIKRGVDSASLKLFNDISQAFANQNLKIDTLNRTITRLKDLGPVIKNYVASGPDPTLNIHTVTGISEHNGHYRIKINSDHAGSTNFDIQCYLLIELMDGTYIFSEPQFFFTDMKIMSTVYVPLIEYRPDIKSIYFYMKGTYSNLSLSKDYKVVYLGHYDPLTKLIYGKVADKNNAILKLMLKSANTK